MSTDESHGSVHEIPLASRFISAKLTSSGAPPSLFSSHAEVRKVEAISTFYFALATQNVVARLS